MAKTQHGRDLTGEELAQTVEEFMNCAGKKDIEAFVMQMTKRTHRTLQQKVMGLLVGCIEAWANETDFDARNEATVKLAKKLVEGTGDKYDRFLPVI